MHNILFKHARTFNLFHNQKVILFFIILSIDEEMKNTQICVHVFFKLSYYCWITRWKTRWMYVYFLSVFCQPYINNTIHPAISALTWF
jgi:hypothetical protein